MKRLITLLLVLTLTLTFTSAVIAQEVTIRYWTQDAAPYVNSAERSIEAFEAENPNINIKLETFSEYRTKVTTAFATKTEGDVIEIYGSIASFAKGDSILPVPEKVMTKEEIENTYIQAALKNKQLEGTYYGLPEELNMESPGLLVNVDLVEKAGMKIPEEWDENNGPANWSELIKFARKLTVIENNVMKQAGLGVVNGQESSMFLSLIWQMGGDFRDPENKEIHFDTKIARDAVKFMKNLIEGENRVHSTNFSGRMDAFMERSAAMTIGAPWYAASFDMQAPDLNYKYYNLPSFIEGADPYFVGEGGWGYIVSSRTENPEAAWKFVDFMMNRENQFKWAETVGAISSRQDADEYFTGDDPISKAIRIAEYAKEPGAYTLDTGQLVWSIVRTNLRSMLHNEVSIDEGLKNMEEEANRMIERNYSRGE
ncbi:MAG: extracellular solute-binding protein [Halanaerobiales bacterium]|nr:extracellular solute-binding protein [Halanaerobiales bacterium]